MSLWGERASNFFSTIKSKLGWNSAAPKADLMDLALPKQANATRKFNRTGRFNSSRPARPLPIKRGDSPLGRRANSTRLARPAPIKRSDSPLRRRANSTLRLNKTGRLNSTRPIRAVPLVPLNPTPLRYALPKQANAKVGLPKKANSNALKNAQVGLPKKANANALKNAQVGLPKKANAAEILGLMNLGYATSDKAGCEKKGGTFIAGAFGGIGGCY
jgi:hypothetical protein